MRDKVFAVVTLMLSGVINANAFIPNNSHHLYEIGQSSVFIPPVSDSVQLNIGGGLSTYSNNSCFNFNRILSIKNNFENIKESLTASLGPVVDNLTGQIAAVAMYKLQNLNPGLYDFVQNTNFDFNENLNVKVANCQEKFKNLQNGGGMLENVVQVSDSQGYLDAIKRDEKQPGTVDIGEESVSLEKEKGKWGVPWIHRKDSGSGGYQEGQKPIELISDVIIAGVNVMLESDRELDSTDDIDSSHKLARYWKNPKQAADFGTYVLGDIKISTKKGEKARDSKAGLGLSAVINNCPQINPDNGDTCVENVRDALWGIVSKSSEPTDEELQSISPENLLITKHVIEAIKNFEQEDKIVAVSTLSERITTQNVINEALMLKRVISAGLKVPEVQNLKEIQRVLHLIREDLDSEIKSLIFEQHARQEMAASTVKSIMDIYRNKANETTSHSSVDSVLVKDGAVYKLSSSKDQNKGK